MAESSNVICCNVREHNRQRLQSFSLLLPNPAAVPECTQSTLSKKRALFACSCRLPHSAVPSVERCGALLQLKLFELKLFGWRFQQLCEFTKLQTAEWNDGMSCHFSVHLDLQAIAGVERSTYTNPENTNLKQKRNKPRSTVSFVDTSGFRLHYFSTLRKIGAAGILLVRAAISTEPKPTKNHLEVRHY